MTQTANQHARGARFLSLHRNPGLFVLANAWDAASARVFEAAGMAAIGTSSAGIAFSLGHPDGQRLAGWRRCWRRCCASRAAWNCR